MLNALSLLALVLPLSQPIVAQQDEPPADGNKLVKVTLYADRDGVQPGQTITLGIHYRITPRWHIYWVNPGDSGLPVKAEITAPPGFEVGAVRYPWPKREEDPGDIVSFIHDGEVMLLVDVKAPANLTPGTEIKFEADGKWLVCTDICVAGQGHASLALTTAAATKPANEKLFASWRDKLPKPWTELTGARVSWSGDEALPKLKLVVPGATALEFFPYASPTIKMTARKVDVGKQGSTVALEWEFERKKPEDKPLGRGVLWVKTAQGETSYLFEGAFSK
jgi:DsbC/DsbD-like thiol-disulfide interchange protein